MIRRMRSKHDMFHKQVETLTAVVCMCGFLFFANSATAQDRVTVSTAEAPNLAVLSSQQWREIETAVRRGLVFIANSQQTDGSFIAPAQGQPGITSLCVMAFLAGGHTPGTGPYGDRLENAIDYVLTTQQQSGLLSVDPRGSGRGGRPNYNHAITGLMLGEAYGMTSDGLSDRIRLAIPRALKFSRMRQTLRKRHPRDKGGWRYIRPYGPNDSDLTATGWQLMFYRSAKNAEFDVPAEFISDAMGYVRRCYQSDEGAFVYGLAKDEEHYASGGTVGSGIVALSMGGEHHTEMAQAGGRWILRHPFTRYNRRQRHDDRYHYSAYYCSQAMFQLGGDYWKRFYPELQQVLLANQRSDGSWDPESGTDGQFGNAYTTSLAVLALTPPYQMLPIYQR